jgi:HD-GYP domain-containing protein (c-di-GMP phosphodiesterase class II)
VDDPAALVPLADLRELLREGETLPFRVLDGAGRLLLAAGQRILDADQLQVLVERGAAVEAAEAERLRRERGQAPVESEPERRLSWFDAWEQQTWRLDAALRALGRGECRREPLEALAEQCLQLIDRQPDAALFVAMRQDQRRFALYALSHGLNTATVAVLCARQLGLSEDAQRTLVRAALTMNAPIVELQAQMAEQTEPPSKRQLESIRAHPHRAVELLRAAGVNDLAWLAAVADHHERDGGSGYPRGLANVGELATLLRAADVYTAKISPRAVRAPLNSQTAAHQLLQETPGSPVGGALVKAIGVYPPGDFVRLKSGEIGVVARRTTELRAPEVLVLLSATAKSMAEPKRRDTRDPSFAIAGVAPRESLPARVLPEQVYGLLEP